MLSPMLHVVVDREGGTGGIPYEYRSSGRYSQESQRLSGVFVTCG